MEINNQKPIVVEIKKTRLEILANVIKIIFKGAIWLFIIFAIVGAFSQTELVTSSYKVNYIDWNGSHVAKKEVSHNVAIVPIYGMIASERTNLFDIASSESILQMLDAAAEDDSIKAIVLRIDSPGGTVFDSEKIALKIIEIKKDKKIYALLEGMAASGGYYIASVCDKIFAYEETITGSIGVIMEFPNAKKLMDKAGVEVISITSGNMKTMGSPFEEFKEEDKEVFKSIINEAYGKFVDRIVEGRTLEEEEVLKLADGRIFSGKQAFENNLIDGSQGVKDLIDELESQKITNYNILEFYVPISAFEKVFGPTGKALSNLVNSQKITSAVMFYK